MRERSTWNRTVIAAAAKVAEDPRAMNQDHLKQQPAADAYVTGTPSDFAEDVAPSNWKAEYSGGEVKRDEIGLPEMRPETFNHPEKTAAQQAEDDATLEKKAAVCIKYAKLVLPKSASEGLLEDQALSFMHLPDSVLIDSYNRLASQQDGQQDDQGKQAQQGQQQTQDQAKEAGQIPENFKKKDDEDKGQQQAKEGGQIPENFKKKDDDKDQGQQGKEAQQQGQQQADEEQKKQAQQGQQQSEDEQKKQAASDKLAALARSACDAMAQGDMQLAQQQIQQMVQQAQGQQQQMMSQQQMQDQVQQMVQQAMQQQGQPAAQQQQAPVMADDKLLDQMLQTDVQASRQVLASAGAPSMDIEIEGPSMDVGEVRLGSDDEALTALFASSPEVQEAAHAHQLQTGMPVQAMTRTASTRTLGTRPTQGVSSLGGAVPASSGGSDVDKLAGLWQSAPDVRSVFNS
jgi:hypothetical protein